LRLRLGHAGDQRERRRQRPTGEAASRRPFVLVCRLGSHRFSIPEVAPERARAPKDTPAGVTASATQPEEEKWYERKTIARTLTRHDGFAYSWALHRCIEQQRASFRLSEEGQMEIVLDKRAVRQIRLSAQDAIEEGDTETLREDILEAFTEEQVEEIERRLDSGDFYEFLTEMLDEWSGDDVDELFELLDAQLGDIGVDVKFEKKPVAAEAEEEEEEENLDEYDDEDLDEDDEDGDDEDDEDEEEDDDED
jgi:hypothetical protein